jgi:hypothetical protein
METLLGPLERDTSITGSEERETPILLGLLERAKFNHWKGRNGDTLLGPLERDTSITRSLFSHLTSSVGAL